jgi:hypothetical protein
MKVASGFFFFCDKRDSFTIKCRGYNQRLGAMKHMPGLYATTDLCLTQNLFRKSMSYHITFSTNEREIKFLKEQAQIPDFPQNGQHT